MPSDLPVSLHRSRPLLKIHTFYHGIFSIALFHIEHRLLEPALTPQFFLGCTRLRLFLGKQGELLEAFLFRCLCLAHHTIRAQADPAHQQIMVYDL